MFREAADSKRTGSRSALPRALELGGRSIVLRNRKSTLPHTGQVAMLVGEVVVE